MAKFKPLKVMVILMGKGIKCKVGMKNVLIFKDMCKVGKGMAKFKPLKVVLIQMGKGIKGKVKFVSVLLGILKGMGRVVAKFVQVLLGKIVSKGMEKFVLVRDL